MSRKLFTITVLLCLFLTSSGTAFAQGKQPPAPSDDSAVVTKSAFGSSLEAQTQTLGSSALTTTGLVNGDFEQGRFVGWSEFSAHGFDVVTHSDFLPVVPHSGSWAAWLGGEDLDTSYLYQDNITIVSPTALRLWYWIGSQDQCGFDYGYVMINAATIYTWNLCVGTNTNGWLPLDLDLNAYNGQTVQLVIQVTTDEALNSNLFIDDVGLYQTFADVSYGYWAESFVHRLYNAGITGGCGTGPLLYCPETTVTRDQMAVFLLRGIHGAAYSPPAVGATTGFDDVPVDYWSAAWIKQLAAEGITGGCSVTPRLYCPTTPVTRDQMAVFLLKSKYGSAYNPPAVGAGTGFGDVPADYWAAPWIKQLVAEGITAGCGSGNYCPQLVVTRSQMAVFVVRTFNLP